MQHACQIQMDLGQWFPNEYEEHFLT